MHRLLTFLLLILPLSGCLSDANGNGGNMDGGEQKVPNWPQWGELETATIRPGSGITIGSGSCTANFLFEGPNGTGYIGTAGHCTDAIGDRLSLQPINQVTDEPGGEFATTVYDSDLAESGVDFTLARIDDDKIALAHPQMWAWEGPTGSISVADLAIGDQLQVYGFGVVVGEVEQTRARMGVLTDWTDDEYNADLPATNGDSGAPLLHESGLAFGIISEYGIESIPPSTDHGPMMDYVFRELAASDYADVRLVTI